MVKQVKQVKIRRRRDWGRGIPFGVSQKLGWKEKQVGGPSLLHPHRGFELEVKLLQRTRHKENVVAVSSFLCLLGGKLAPLWRGKEFAGGSRQSGGVGRSEEIHRQLLYLRGSAASQLLLLLPRRVKVFAGVGSPRNVQLRLKLEEYRLFKRENWRRRRLWRSFRASRERYPLLLLQRWSEGRVAERLKVVDF